MQLLTQAKNNVSALELHRQVGVSYPTAWLMKHKLLEVMRQREGSRQLTGRLEIDDAYLGGQRSGGKAGRGSENKIRDEQKLTHREALAGKLDFIISPKTKLALTGQWNWYDLNFTQRGPQFVRMRPVRKATASRQPMLMTSTRASVKT